MDAVLAAADKTALVAMVKLTQQRGMKGSSGGWKDFVDLTEKHIKYRVRDPAKRSEETLTEFLRTFTKEEDINMFNKSLECHSKGEVMEKVREGETPEQNLARLTAAHPRFSIDYSLPTHEEGWVATEIATTKVVMLSISCEMVLCEDGTEAIAEVCAVDQNLQVRLQQLVNPEKPVKDYRTEITGIRAEKMREVSCSLADVQQSSKQILSRDTILVGHGLHNYLKALKLDHARVIEISYIFKYASKKVHKRPSFDSVCLFMLGQEVRKPGDSTNCFNVAYAAMKIVLDKINHGSDGLIPLVRETKSLPSYSLENYTAVATFKSIEEADVAFKTISGVDEKDSSGCPQKVVTFEFASGKRCNITVRKRLLGKASSKKRVVPFLELVAKESQRLKTM